MRHYLWQCRRLRVLAYIVRIVSDDERGFTCTSETPCVNAGVQLEQEMRNKVVENRKRIGMLTNPWSELSLRLVTRMEPPEALIIRCSLAA